MVRDILDDPNVVQPVFEELRKNFYSGVTRTVEFRKNALECLLAGYIAL
jgi:hypothetical protein